MGVNLFKNTTQSIPESDAQIVRVPLDQLDIGGRKSHIPSASKAADLALSHTSGASVPGNGK